MIWEKEPPGSNGLALFLHNRSFIKMLDAARFSKLKLSVRLAMDHACHIACAKSIVNIDDRDSVCA